MMAMTEKAPDALADDRGAVLEGEADGDRVTDAANPRPARRPVTRGKKAGAKKGGKADSAGGKGTDLSVDAAEPATATDQAGGNDAVARAAGAGRECAAGEDAPAAAGAGTAPPQPASPLEVIGPVVGLMMQSLAHKYVFVSDLEWMVVPALAARQFRLYRRDGRAVAYASWALVDEHREQRLKAGQVRLAPQEWRCGDRVWLYDIVAPFGGADDIIRDIRENVFPDRPVRTVQISADGKDRVTVEWPAAGRERAAADAAARASNGDT